MSPSASTDREQRIADLRRRFEEAGEWVSLDGRVNEDSLARLLFRASKRTMNNWRRNGEAPPFYVMPGKNVTYELGAIVDWFERRRVGPTDENFPGQPRKTSEMLGKADVV